MKQTPLSPSGTVAGALARLGIVPEPGDKLTDFARSLMEGASGRDVEPETVFLCRELLRECNELPMDSQQALLLLMLALLAGANDGSTRLPLVADAGGSLARLVASLVGGAAGPAEVDGLVRAMIRLAQPPEHNAMLGGGDTDTPLVVHEGFVYQRRFHGCEERVATDIAARLARPGREIDTVRGVLGQMISETAAVLSDEQAAAVVAGLTLPFAVITGGPGTGKTAIVRALVQTAGRLGVEQHEIALAAPTGKAAQRMADSLDSSRLTAQTLHRLLGYSPRSGRFQHHANHPLAARLVIVDEASMVGLSLLDQLLQAVAPEASLILLGDANQLPSVDAGAAFRDLVASGQRCSRPAFSAQLTRSYRMDPADPEGLQILTAAQRVNDGDQEGLFPRGDSGVRTVSRANDLAFAGVELLDTSATATALPDFVKRWYAEHGRGDAPIAELAGREVAIRDGTVQDADEERVTRLLELCTRSRLLTVSRSLDLGADVVNQWMHELALAEAGREQLGDLCPGELLMVGRNDYQRGLFNGDQGVIALAREHDGPAHLRAFFPRDSGLASFNAAALRAHASLSAATTVHKSQGSEFEHVAIILPSVDLPVATRELLYTGLTRARRSVTIVGDPKILRASVARSISRHSGLADRLSLLLAAPGHHGEAE